MAEKATDKGKWLETLKGYLAVIVRKGHYQVEQWDKGPWYRTPERDRNIQYLQGWKDALLLATEGVVPEFLKPKTETTANTIIKDDPDYQEFLEYKRWKASKGGGA